MAAMAASNFTREAALRSRHDRAELAAELRRLDKEKRGEIRMADNRKHKFRARYAQKTSSKDSITSPSSSQLGKSSPTHSIQSVGYDHLHSLLFTNGELDIEKILCLHLLSTHRTDNLIPTKRVGGTGNKTGDSFRDSPVERLIERSKTKAATESITSISKVLPTYVLELPSTYTSTNGKGGKRAIRVAEDGRLSARLAVNGKIAELTEAVLAALQHSNPEKIAELIALVGDVSRIKSIFRKQHVQEFLDSLKASYLLSSCESFVLAPPFKINPTFLEIKTLSGTLEDVVDHIHRSILQYPVRDTWRAMYQEQVTGVPVSDKASSSDTKEVSSNVSRRQPPKNRRAPKEVGMVITKTAQVKGEQKESSTVEQSGGRKNFIEINKEAAGVTKKRSNLEKEDNVVAEKSKSIKDPNKRRRSPTLGERAIRSNNNKGPTSEDITSRKSYDVESKETITNDSPKTSDILSTLLTSPIRRSSTFNYERQHIRQTSCAACKERWRAPLPDPKIPTPPRSPKSSDILKPDSATRIANLIETERFRLDSYSRRYNVEGGNVGPPGRGNVKIAKPLDAYKMSFESLSISAFDLARIKQEIRERETKKKLEKFLYA